MTTDGQMVAMAMELLALRRELDELKSGNGKTASAGGGRKAHHTRDTKTGRIYKSRAAAGMAVAPELGLKIHNFVWYEVLAKVGDSRFEDVTDEDWKAFQELEKEKAENKTPVQQKTVEPAGKTPVGK